MNLSPILEQIGLTNSEVKVYLALLKLGHTSTGPLVDTAQIARSKVYDILEKLQKKGLVSYVLKESVKYYSAANPQQIIAYLDEQKQHIDKNKLSITKILPQLQNLHKEHLHEIPVQVFFGVKGMHSAFNELFAEFTPETTYYAFGAGEGENIQQTQRFFNDLHKKRVKANVFTKIIYTESARGLFESQTSSELVEARYLLQTAPTAINVYKQKTILVILNKEPISILIQSKETAESFLNHFQLLWNLASS